MSNLLFNIRFGTTHFQVSKEWKFIISKNPHHVGNPKKFEIYCLFGKHFN